VDSLGGLLFKVISDKEDVTLPERTEEVLFPTDNHTVETVNCGSSVHCDWSNEQSVCKYLMPADTVSFVNDEFEQSVDKGSDCTDPAVDYHDGPGIAEKRVLVDSVFFACDPTDTGYVNVSDVITYLRDTLHVSSCLYT